MVGDWAEKGQMKAGCHTYRPLEFGVVEGLDPSYARGTLVKRPIRTPFLPVPSGRMFSYR